MIVFSSSSKTQPRSPSQVTIVPSRSPAVASDSRSLRQRPARSDVSKLAFTHGT